VRFKDRKEPKSLKIVFQDFRDVNDKPTRAEVSFDTIKFATQNKNSGALLILSTDEF
jgi:hypothetical protein